MRRFTSYQQCTRFGTTLEFDRYYNRPGHSCWTQGLVCLAGPRQALPPLAGVGLSHDRVLWVTPSPHVILHRDHDDHDEYWPCTGHINIQHIDHSINQSISSKNVASNPTLRRYLAPLRTDFTDIRFFSFLVFHLRPLISPITVCFLTFYLFFLLF